MMFSATMTSETRGPCKKFISDPHEFRVDEESKLTLHGLLQYYSKLTEKEKNRKLNDLVDVSGIQPCCGLREVCAESDCPRRVARHVCCASHAEYMLQEVSDRYSHLQKSRTTGSELQCG